MKLLHRRIITEYTGLVSSHDLVDQVSISGAQMQELVADVNPSLSLDWRQIMWHLMGGPLAQLQALSQCLLNSSKTQVSEGRQPPDREGAVTIEQQTYLAELGGCQLGGPPRSGCIPAVSVTILEALHPVVNCVL